MKRTSMDSRRAKLAGTFVAMMAGGSLFTSCQTRIRDSVVGGSRSFVLSLLDPAAILAQLATDVNQSPTSN